jgi:hypothetical protein
MSTTLGGFPKTTSDENNIPNAVRKNLKKASITHKSNYLESQKPSLKKQKTKVRPNALA